MQQIPDSTLKTFDNLVARCRFISRHVSLIMNTNLEKGQFCSMLNICIGCNSVIKETISPSPTGPDHFKCYRPLLDSPHDYLFGIIKLLAKRGSCMRNVASFPGFLPPSAIILPFDLCPPSAWDNFGMWCMQRTSRRIFISWLLQ